MPENSAYVEVKINLAEPGTGTFTYFPELGNYAPIDIDWSVDRQGKIELSVYCDGIRMWRFQPIDARFEETGKDEARNREILVSRYIVHAKEILRVEDKSLPVFRDSGEDVILTTAERTLTGEAIIRVDVSPCHLKPISELVEWLRLTYLTETPSGD
ncbi:MAG: hypothetical protein WCO23_00100 [bacterium]